MLVWLCPVPDQHSLSYLLTLSWVRALYYVCMYVYGGVSAANEVKLWVGGPVTRVSVGVQVCDR